jgi:O-acetyl-ADP-ribose deacetylase (regulator of RNase III)
MGSDTKGVIAERVLALGPVVQLVQGDITVETSDAIVNAANAHLQHGGGLAGAIVRGGGPDIQRESDAWVRTHGPVSHSQPAWTSGGQLPAKYVIHAVGPIWDGGDSDEDAELAAATRGSLSVANELKCESISMPAISTGIFGFPRERAARVMLSAIEEYFATRGTGLRSVRLVLLDQATVEVFLREWKRREL